MNAFNVNYPHVCSFRRIQINIKFKAVLFAPDRYAIRTAIRSDYFVLAGGSVVYTRCTLTPLYYIYKRVCTTHLRRVTSQHKRRRLYATINNNKPHAFVTRA